MGRKKRRSRGSDERGESTLLSGSFGILILFVAIAFFIGVGLVQLSGYVVEPGSSLERIISDSGIILFTVFGFIIEFAIILLIKYSLWRVREGKSRALNMTSSMEMSGEEIKETLMAKRASEGKLIDGNPELDIYDALRAYSPPRKFKYEEAYQADLARYLKQKFPNTRLEETRGSSRPDIVIEHAGFNSGIEVKGPTTNTDLDSIPSKDMRYRQHFDHVFAILFDVRTSPAYYDEWKEGMRKSHPAVFIIKK